MNLNYNPWNICYTGLNEPKLQSLENKVFKFEFEFFGEH